MESKHDSNLPRQKLGKKEPKSKSFPQNNMNQEQIKEEESLIRDNEEQFQEFENIPMVYEWVNLETSERRNEYYPVKQILAVSPIGSSLSEMIFGYKRPKQFKFKIDDSLTFSKGNNVNGDKKHWKIVKANRDKFDENYLKDELMVLLLWNIKKYSNTFWIVPLSFADTRQAFLLLYNCLAFRKTTEEKVFKAAQKHYNDHYLPEITDRDLEQLKEHHQKTCGHSFNGNIEIFNKNNLSAIYVSKNKRFLVFEEDENVEIVDEKKVVNNPFFDITQEEVDETQAETISTQFSNKELIKYDYSKKHVGPRTFLGKNKKKQVKIDAMSDQMCIRKTLRYHRIFIKNNIAVKLLKLNFREECEEMKKYNEILLPFRCRFEFLGAGFGRINRLTEFIGNVVVVKKADHNSRYHMIHVRKRKIEEQTFQECEMLRKFEGDFFVYFQYILHKDKQEPKSRGRKKGVKIINKI